MASEMERSIPEFSIGWSGDRRILVESSPGYGLEFTVSSDGKGILAGYLSLGLPLEDIDDHYVEAGRREAENFLRRQHGGH
jgi:hypothetical protein